MADALNDVLKVSAAPLAKDLLDKAVPAEIEGQHSGELFMVMCELTGGEANSLVRSVASKPEFGKCGFAAFYALSHCFYPRTPGRALQFLTTVVSQSTDGERCPLNPQGDRRLGIKEVDLKGRVRGEPFREDGLSNFDLDVTGGISEPGV